MSKTPPNAFERYLRRAFRREQGYYLTCAALSLGICIFFNLLNYAINGRSLSFVTQSMALTGFAALGGWAAYIEYRFRKGLFGRWKTEAAVIDEVILEALKREEFLPGGPIDRYAPLLDIHSRLRLESRLQRKRARKKWLPF